MVLTNGIVRCFIVKGWAGDTWFWIYLIGVAWSSSLMGLYPDREVFKGRLEAIAKSTILLLNDKIALKLV